MPKFSIIIPVYNVAPYLRECLDSVLEAERRLGERIEIICIDDGSTDGSARILDEYAQRLNSQLSTLNFIVIHQENAGVGAARNAGLDRATCEWVWCVDADDVIHPGALKHLNSELAGRGDSPSALFVGLAHGIGGEFPPLNARVKDFVLTRESQDLVWRTPAYTLFRRELIGDLRFEKFTIAEDVIFTMSFLKNNPHGWLECEDVLYYYRQREGSASTFKPSVEYLDESFISGKKLIGLMNEVLVPHKCIISWYRDEVYQTRKWTLFRLPSKVTKKYLSLYFENFWSYNKIQKHPFDRRLAVFLFQLLPLPVFGKMLIYYRELVYVSTVRFIKHSFRMN